MVVRVGKAERKIRKLCGCEIFMCPFPLYFAAYHLTFEGQTTCCLMENTPRSLPEKHVFLSSKLYENA